MSGARTDKQGSGIAGAIVRWCGAHPWPTLGALALVTATLCSGLPRLRVEANIDERELPREDHEVASCLRIESVFGETSPVTLALQLPAGETFFSARHLRTVGELSARLKRLPELVPGEVLSLTEVSDVSFAGGAVDSRKIVEPPLTPARLPQIREQLLSNALWAGRLVDAEGATTLLTATTVVGARPERLYDRIQAVARAVPPPVRALATGGDLLPVAMTRAIDRDLQLFTPLAFLFVIVGFYLSFRRLAGVVFPVVVIAVSLVWLLGLMGLLGVPLNPVTTVIPPTMVALGSSYGIHFINRCYRARASGLAGREAVARAGSIVGRPLVVAGITTAVGMATLMAFKIRMIQQFGLFMALGILLVVAVTLTLVPALLSVCKVELRVRPDARRPLLVRAMGCIAALCRHRARAVLLVGAGVTAAAGWLALRTAVGIDLPSYFPADHEQRQVNDLISGRLGGAAEATLMVGVDPRTFPGGTRSPRLLERLMRFEQAVRRIQGVGHVQSLADVVQHVHRRVQQGLDEGEGPAWPAAKAHVDQLLLLHAMGAGMGAIDRLEDASHTRAAVKVAIRTWDQAEHRRILDAIRRAFAGAFPRGATLTPGGDVVLMMAFDRYIVWGKLVNIALTLLLVFVCCAAVYRSVRLGVISLIPVSFSTLITFGLMGALGIRLTMATAVITSIAIGVGVDFAIHLIDHYREARAGQGGADAAISGALEGVGPAVVYDAGSNILGFLPLVLSALVPVQHFGWLVSSCMLSSALATLFVLPAVLQVLADRRERRRSPAALLEPTTSTEGTR